MPATANDDLESLELALLLEGIVRRYGYDLRDYANASLLRRVRQCVAGEGLLSISDLQSHILRDPAALERFLYGMTVHVSAMFRDPGFYTAFREHVAPLLRTYSHPRIWVAGCARGEEAYSLAVLLAEEGLSDRCRIYATDISDTVLDQARAGVFRLADLAEYTRNYHASGGRRQFSDYCVADGERISIAAPFRRNILFARHCLVSDRVFNEFQVVCCRNVMIYFNRTLQDRVHRLIWDSLGALGFLCLGRSETLRFTPHENSYETVDEAARIYQRRH